MRTQSNTDETVQNRRRKNESDNLLTVFTSTSDWSSGLSFLFVEIPYYLDTPTNHTLSCSRMTQSVLKVL